MWGKQQTKRDKSEYCPQCGYQYIAHSKCMNGPISYICQNGHWWMDCPTHKNRYVIDEKFHNKNFKCSGGCLRASYHYTNVDLDEYWENQTSSSDYDSDDDSSEESSSSDSDYESRRGRF